MFKALQPLLQERSIHILLSANKDGKIGVYVSPVKKDDKEDAAFVTPFRCEGTAEELDNELSGVLTQWLASRTAITTSLTEALAAAEAQTKAAADEAKKKACLLYTSMAKPNWHRSSTTHTRRFLFLGRCVQAGSTRQYFQEKEDGTDYCPCCTC